ncbi:conserved hypothetical protein [Paraburkholderia unamae]|nr:conserved hypothetical protein [Paraburkholderia unamae]
MAAGCEADPAPSALLRGSGKSFQLSGRRVREVRYLFIIKAILKDSKVVVCWIVRGFARTSASSS